MWSILLWKLNDIREKWNACILNRWNALYEVKKPLDIWYSGYLTDLVGRVNIFHRDFRIRLYGTLWEKQINTQYLFGDLKTIFYISSTVEVRFGISRYQENL